MTEEVLQPDGDPVPVRLFGEDLVAFRDTDGAVGLMDRYCPHRRASLEFGRNEDGGLRCLYHGWKVNVLGDVVEMPSEPPGACAAMKFKHKTYPTHEHGGFVWAYMGPPDAMPEFQPPPFAPTANCKVSIAKIKIDCNWAQILEGAIDSAHSSTLHSSDIVPARVSGTRPTGNIFARPSTDKAPRIQVQPTDYGFKYAAIRRPIQNADTLDYVRMSVYVAPFVALIPPNSQYNICNVNVPIDDTHTMFHFISWSEDNGAVDQEEYRKLLAAQIGIDIDKRYRKVRTLENSYLQDRQLMKLGNFTGIRGFPNQDIAMWETMGPIADRTVERLGASDQAIVTFRKLMVDAVRRFRDGEPALGAAGASQIPQASIRSFEGMLPKGAEWRHLDQLSEQAKLKTA
ncbi:MAG TPA: Rieske 2Fe-2S domain-containing protein [Ramlibacter sp.]|nr:Rieske 2Fe-2S domain-containing protein [Ramlibacter sp.]